MYPKIDCAYLWASMKCKQVTYAQNDQSLLYFASTWIKLTPALFSRSIWKVHENYMKKQKLHNRPWAKPFGGFIRPESSLHVFLLPKTLNLKKKSGGHQSVVAFGSEWPLSENIYTFGNVFAATFNTTFKGFNFIEL